MSHPQQIKFVQKILSIYGPTLSGQCYDFGSLDINGSIRPIVESYGLKYTGIDIGEGANVDVISKAHEFKPSEQADLVTSCEMLEHDPYWDKSLANMYKVLKSGGLMILSCATHGRPEHGTARTSPGDSPLTQEDESWRDYYRNLGPEDFEVVYKDEMFTDAAFMIGNETHDLYFYGIKA